MSTPPALSVVIACHDAEPFIGAALESALQQEPPPAEVVVCDDGSRDGSASVVRGFGDRVRLVSHAVNRGESAAKNSAVRAATSDVVVFLDADDRFLPGRLAAIGDLLADQPELDIVTTDAVLEHDGQVLGRWYQPGHDLPIGDQRLVMLRRNAVFGHAAVRRAAFLAVGGFDESLSHAADWDCWIRMVLRGSRIGVVDEPLAVYRLHPNNSSANRLAMTRGNVELLRRVQARGGLSEEEKRVLAETIAEHEVVALRETMKDALSRPDGAVRRTAWEVVRDRRQPVRSRLMATATVAAPHVAQTLYKRQSARSWSGPGGVRLPVGAAPSER